MEKTGQFRKKIICDEAIAIRECSCIQVGFDDASMISDLTLNLKVMTSCSGVINDGRLVTFVLGEFQNIMVRHFFPRIVGHVPEISDYIVVNYLVRSPRLLIKKARI